MNNPVDQPKVSELTEHVGKAIVAAMQGKPHLAHVEVIDEGELFFDGEIAVNDLARAAIEAYLSALIGIPGAEKGEEALTKPVQIARRMREIVQAVWDKQEGYTDRQAWSDLHGQAMQLLEWETGYSSDPPAPTSERVQALETALAWYAEQVENCRKITREGDTARHALDADGGKRARDALLHEGQV